MALGGIARQLEVVVHRIQRVVIAISSMCPLVRMGRALSMPSTMPNPARRIGASVSFFQQLGASRCERRLHFGILSRESYRAFTRQ